MWEVCKYFKYIRQSTVLIVIFQGREWINQSTLFHEHVTVEKSVHGAAKSRYTCVIVTKYKI